MGRILTSNGGNVIQQFVKEVWVMGGGRSSIKLKRANSAVGYEGRLTG